MEHLAHGVPYIRLGSKDLAGTNTLAYYSKAAVTKKKVYGEKTHVGQCYLTFFTITHKTGQIS